jgi:hypothetical protein
LAPTGVLIEVTNTDRPPASATYTYLPSPKVTSISPAVGPTAGGQSSPSQAPTSIRPPRRSSTLAAWRRRV